jgi:5'-nucleotidase / UDP-sugar diphosphatase
MKTVSRKLVVLLVLASMLFPSAAFAQPAKGPDGPVSFSILHTNDFHGNLELAGSNPGAARVAQKIADVRTAVGDANVLVLDAGDIMQGTLISNLQKGLPTIDYYRTIGYDAVTFGNHEFDWGQTVLGERIAQAEAAATADESPVQMIVANITKNDGGACTWEPFNANVSPYEVFTVGTAPNAVRVGVIGVGSVETPHITIADATAGLCFRDPAESILHYYDELDAASDVIVVLSHNGFTDGGYGYGITVYGDQTLAKKLNDAGKPAHMIIGGHSHTDVSTAAKVGNTTIAQAHYAGRKVGRADFTFDPANGAVTVAWSRLVVIPPDPKASPPVAGDPEHPVIKTLVDDYANDPAYQTLINEPVGYSAIDLLRNYNGNSMMADFVNDAIYGALNGDADATNDVDVFFNNPGGIRADWCWSGSSWVGTGCKTGLHDPALLTYGHMFQILPFGNATAVGKMNGAQIYDLLQQSATLFKGALQPAGVRYKFFRYSDALPGPQPYAWGAYDIEVYNKTAMTWEALDLKKTYSVGTNEFLAPAGQDGFVPFKYMTNITYWGDMLDSVNIYVKATYTMANPYKGPNGDGNLDGRITRNGDGDDTYELGEIVPVTILHHNDSHGRLLKSGNFQGLSQLATLIRQERQHNPGRTLLFSMGDNIQGDSMMYYLKNAGQGKTADGTDLPANLHTNPFIAAMNALSYNGMLLGNHEFNFGAAVFQSTFGQADFPLLGANMTDSGGYGVTKVGLDVAPPAPELTPDADAAKIRVHDGLEYSLPTGDPANPVKLGVLGLTNHRVPNYELPSNIPGLSFQNPIDTAQALVPQLNSRNHGVVALTHIGFTEDPKSVEVDANVDTNLAATVPGIDVILGSHSHTNPATGFGDYKYLPAFVAGPNNVPVLVNQAYRYNTYLGEVVLGFMPLPGGAYEVVSRAGRDISVPIATQEDPTIKAIVDPYQTIIDEYNQIVIGKTAAPIDTTGAYIAETSAANLQADASVWMLESNDVDVDVHLSGAMTRPSSSSNWVMFKTATTATPAEMKVSDMFTLMPYENSLVVIRMNGPQLKAVLERAYRNYFYYKHVPGYGGYSYYTTCMLDTDKGNVIKYHDTHPSLPNGNNVLSLTIQGQPVDFSNATKFYNVSTVNYLAAGACNFSDAGVSLWPLNQIAQDTQYYVRDAVIAYAQAQAEPITPAVEGRVVFRQGSPIYLPLVFQNYKVTEWLDLTLLHTNDFHARVDEYNVSGARCKPVDATAGNCIAGAPRLATAVKAIRDSKANVLLVDSGDQFQGTLFYNVFRGDVLNETMNYLGYDAMAIGNHEFDNGPITLAEFVDGADFPVLSANTDASADPNLNGKILPFAVVERGGSKIGIIGLTTPETENISSPGPNITFSDPAISLQAAADTLAATGVNKIVALSHMGYDADLTLAHQVSGVDVIVGAHSHTFLYNPVATKTFTLPNLTLTPAGSYPTVVQSPDDEPVLVVTAYQWGTLLGRLDVTFDPDGEVHAYSGNPIYLGREVAKDPALDVLLQPYRDAVTGLIATEVGQTTVDLPISVSGKRICRLGECLMGNVVADAMLDKANAFFPGGGYQIAFQNGGGLRAPILAGTVTLGDVMETLPFGNAIATFQLKGEHVKAALENGARLYPAENGGFAQVAGMRYVIDPAQPAGSRITSAEVWTGTTWAPLDMNVMYYVVTNDFMRRGGDNYLMFRDHAVDPYDFGPALDEALADYFDANSPVTPLIEGRITGVPVP